MFLETDQPWPRNTWYHAAWSHEIEEKPFPRTLLGDEVVLFRNADGMVSALEDRCCHRATPLRLGDVVPGGLQCGYHGMVFDGAGTCVEIPGQDNIPSRAKVKSYPIVEQQEIVWIWMGDPALADASQIVDHAWHDDHEKWPHKHGLYNIKCNYNLLIDNLMDLTHIPFIHRNTIGGGSHDGQINAIMNVTPKDTGVHYIRWMLGIIPPPTYVKAAGFADGVRVDRWQEFEYIAPCTVVQWTGALEEGRGAQENQDQEGGFNIRVYHGATPETEDSVHYFWSAANGYKPDDDAATELLYTEIAATFLEDLEFLEAQQIALAATSDDELVNTKYDEARMASRRAIVRIINAETGGAAIAAE